MNSEVVGLATCISTSLEGDQVIQGLNFLIPVDTIHELATRIGLTPKSDSPFMREWEQAVSTMIDGRYREALSHLDTADRIVPGLIDLDRTRARLQDRLKEAR